MNFQVQILGSNAAIPAYGRHPTSQVVTIHDIPYLVDCGEGTQMRMNTFKIKKGKIGHIFISHLHGDHIFGLIGLITSYSLLKRKRPLHIYGPKGIQEILDVHLKNYKSESSFNLQVNIITEARILFENNDIMIHTFPVKHGIECYGFRFSEKPLQRKILKEKIEEYTLTFSEIVQAKNGEDILRGKKRISNSELTVKVREPKSYAYCTDTIATEETIPFIKGADLLYHEATFLDEDKARAVATFHSTTKEAGELAKKAEVKNLIIGHFSAKYKNLDPLLNEVQSVFPDSKLALEGEIFEV